MSLPEMWNYLLLPFLACLVLTGIHCYLGLHVVSRGVIFVDLSLAQLAFLGTAVTATALHFWHYPEAHPELDVQQVATESQPTFESGDSEITLEDVEALIPDDTNTPDAEAAPAQHAPGETHTVDAVAPYLGGLLFTLIGAAIFAVTRVRNRMIPQEAIIGIVYAVAAAATVIVIYKSPLDALQQTESMLVGRLLFVRASDIIHATILYVIIGIVHFVCRRPFGILSFHPELEVELGGWAPVWDFFFYATFGLVVTSSVQMAGVLLVFCFLIVPAVAAMLVARALMTRLLLGWAIGFCGSVLGITLSVLLDAPTGASTVLAFGVLLVVIALVRRFILPREQIAAVEGAS